MANYLASLINWSINTLGNVAKQGVSSYQWLLNQPGPNQMFLSNSQMLIKKPLDKRNRACRQISSSLYHLKVYYS